MKLRRKKPGKPERLPPSSLHFVCEKDGVPERELKAALCEELAHFPSVRSAYLVVAYRDDPSEQDVVLVVGAPPDLNVVNACGQRFWALFSPREHLDITFVGNQGEPEVQEYASSFYVPSG
jgi:hypothetical protein